MTGCASGGLVRLPRSRTSPPDLPEELLHQTLRAATQISWQGWPLRAALPASTAALVRDTLQALADTKP
jgi:hypothetical protein